MVTPCEKMGYKVGDLFQFKTKQSEYVTSGSIVVLCHDDGSEEPKFVKKDCYDGQKQYDYNDFDFINLQYVEPFNKKSADKISSVLQQVEELTEALIALDVAYSKVKHLLNFKGE